MFAKYEVNDGVLLFVTQSYMLTVEFCSWSGDDAGKVFSNSWSGLIWKPRGPKLA